VLNIANIGGLNKILKLEFSFGELPLMMAITRTAIYNVRDMHSTISRSIYRETDFARPRESGNYCRWRRFAVPRNFNV